MQFSHLKSLLTMLAIAGLMNVAGEKVGGRCSPNGTYACADTWKQITVCHNGYWMVAADCGTKRCLWPDHNIYPTPFCR